MPKFMINGYEVIVDFYDQETGEYLDELPPKRELEFRARLWASLDQMQAEKIKRLRAAERTHTNIKHLAKEKSTGTG